MYGSFFQLKKKPFDLLPNPEFLYLSKSHKRVLTYLNYGIKDRAGFILLTGEIGSGKTTVIRNIVKKQLKNVTLAKVFNTKVSSHQLLAMINDDFGIETEGRDKTALLRDLNEFLIDQYAQGNQCVLIIDEAQNLTRELLEEVRMLSNLETDKEKLLQIILVGQPELRQILAGQELLQLRQRIQVNCHINPLSQEEVEEYILTRLEKAGNREAMTFTPEAFEAIYKYSRGIPRLINIICDYIMLDAYAAQRRETDGKTVHELAQDLSFETQYWESSAPAGNAGEGAFQVEETAAVNLKGARTLGKLNMVLRNLSKRLEVLEDASSKCNQDMLIEMNLRIGELERSVGAQLDEMRRSILQIKNELHSMPQPAARPAPSLSRLEMVPAMLPEKKRQRGWVWNFLWGE